ncbi:MAG: alpha/beta fold hydrolase [Burkholderiaceae bacterium]|nr:alpha/beta fold hydrolase [Microbacteriaceae bacterium]
MRRASLVLLAGLGAVVAAWLIAHSASPRVTRWAPGAGERLIHGQLSARVFGGGAEVVVLLPGIAASGTFFGTAWDRLGVAATVVVVDPLGFGHSMTGATGGSRPGDSDVDAVTRSGIAAHCDAIEGLLAHLGLTDRRITAVGHSMGAALALHLADRRDRPGDRVVAFDAPLYVTRPEALGRVHGMGWFEALLSNGLLAERVCAWMCAHRSLAALLSVAVNPTMPVVVAREGVLHTWESYIGSFDAVVTSDAWVAALDRLDRRRVPVHLIDGADDPVPVPGRAAALEAAHPNVTAQIHPGRHDLPLSDPAWCAEQVALIVRKSAP